jgi:hypothetical protein
MPSVELECAFFALSALNPLNRRTDDDSQHLRSKCQRYLASSLAEIQGLLVRSGKACFLKYDGTYKFCASSHTSKTLIKFKVIHIILSVEQGVKDLPLLLSTPFKTPENPDENFGSQDYGTRPVVIGVGGGFDNAMIEETRSACKNVGKGVLWVSYFFYGRILTHKNVCIMFTCYSSEPILIRSPLCRRSATQTQMASRQRRV